MYINRWLLGETEEQPCVFEQSVSSGEVNRWLRDGAAINEQEGRRRRIEERRKRGAPPYSSAPPVSVIHVPLDNPRIERSGFWFNPTFLRTWGKTRIRPEAEGVFRFRLAVCGGAALYADGRPLFDFTPFTRNVPAFHEFSLELGAREHELCVFFDDIAERDTLYFFELKLLEAPAEIRCTILPPEDEIYAAEKMFLESCFTRNSYETGPVTLNMENPFDRTLTLRVRTGPEKFWEWSGVREFDAAFPPGSRQCVLARAEDLVLGYHHCELSLTLGGAALVRRFGFEIYRRMIPADTIEERRAQALDLVRRFAAEDAAKALALLAAEKPDGRAEAICRTTLAFTAARGDCSDFQLAPLLHIWKNYRERLPGTLRPLFRETILGFRYWCDEPGNDAMWFYSENHALMFHVCAFAAGSAFPAETFSNSGLSGGELKDKAEKLLESWFARFFEEGFTEWNSAAYIPVNVSGLAYLYLWDREGPLGALARRALDRICALLACFGSRGIMACSCGRCYDKELFGDRSNETSFISAILWGRGHYNNQGMGTVPLCLSDYTPPPGLDILLSPPSLVRIHCGITQGIEAYANIYSYKTSGFTLSTALDFRSGKKGYQEQICQLNMGAGLNVFVNHPGELAAGGQGRPSYWAGNGILPRAFQYGGIAVLEYAVPPDQDAAFTHAGIPLSESFRYELEEKRLFFECGPVFGLLYAGNGLAPTRSGINAGRELTSPGRKNVWIIKAADAADYTDFESFKAEARSLDERTVYAAFPGESKRPPRGFYTIEAPVRGLAEKTARRMMSLEKGETRETYPVSLIDMAAWEWPQGVGLLGLVRLYRLTGDPDLLRYIHSWYAARIAEGLPEKNVNTMAPMLAMTELQAIDPRADYLALIEENAAWIMKDLLRCGPGLFQHMITGDPNPGQVLIDTLFMTCLFLASAGRLLERPGYIEESNRQFLMHIDCLFDRQSGLFYHGYDFTEKHHYGNVHWGRGNGWYTCCAADYLELASPPHEVRERMETVLRIQCGALAALQDTGGMWRTVLDNGESYLETSATAAIAYGMFRGVDTGILDPSFYDTAWKALDAVAGRIAPDGTVEGVSYGTPVGYDQAFYMDIPCRPMTYGQALALLALCRAAQGTSGVIFKETAGF